jgi:Transposase DDE domain
MRRRSAIVEHPFGILKCRASYRHVLLRGFNKVRGEWSLMALCYNFTRVLNIAGSSASWPMWRQKHARLTKTSLQPLCDAFGWRCCRSGRPPAASSPSVRSDPFQSANTNGH